MNNIIPFVPDRSRQALRGGATEMSATLLFFTGVRYERRTESPAVEPQVRMLAGPPRKLGGPHKPGKPAGAAARANPFHDDTTPMGRGRRG